MIPQNLIDCIKNDRTQISDYISALDCPVVCEIGIRFGDNFARLLTRNVCVAVAVDPWRLFESKDCDPEAPYTQQDLDKQHDSFVSRFLTDARVMLDRMTSLEASTRYEDEYFDFIYIDGNHKYEHCKNDLNAWWSKVKKGGILAGHDYINVRDFGVIQAVEEFKLENNISPDNFYKNQDEYASYYIFKE